MEVRLETFYKQFYHPKKYVILVKKVVVLSNFPSHNTTQYMVARLNDGHTKLSYGSHCNDIIILCT
jgi:hypothetical protein